MVGLNDGILFGEREAPAPGASSGARRRSAETWARVRAAYAAGVSAPELCARFDVGLTALRTRAREEGWRRADAPDPEPLLDPEDDDDAPPATPAELRALAWRRMTAAVRRGRVVEANGWMRLVRQLDAVAGVQDASPAQQARAADALARASAAVAALRPPAPPSPAVAPPPTETTTAPARPPPPQAAATPQEPAASRGETDAEANVPASMPLAAPPDPEISPRDPQVPHDPNGVSHVRGPVLPTRPSPWVRAALGLR